MLFAADKNQKGLDPDFPGAVDRMNSSSSSSSSPQPPLSPPPLALLQESLYQQILSVLGSDINSDIHLFAYGSLIWRPEAAFSTPRKCRALGVLRRFWMQSIDHRGTPSYPGRVCSLISSSQSESSSCEGLLYTISAIDAPETLISLAEREKAGYRLERIFVRLDDNDSTIDPIQAFTFLSDPQSSFLVPTDEREIIKTAQIIQVAKGPSGSNLVYFKSLYTALTSLKIEDDYIEELNKAIDSLQFQTL